MPYVITNPRRVVVHDPETRKNLPFGKTTLSDEDFEKLKSGKLGASLLEGGLLRAEKLPEPKAREPKPENPAPGAGPVVPAANPVGSAEAKAEPDPVVSTANPVVPAEPEPVAEPEPPAAADQPPSAEPVDVATEQVPKKSKK